MRRPLEELPLHQFLIAVQDSKHSRNNKRPLSPGGTAILSPAKRRNLAGQDMFSPERTFQSPSSSMRTTALASRFSDVLFGPQSPARILNFGLPKHFPGDPEKRPVSEIPVNNDVDLTPTRRQPSSSRLAPSPELKPQSIRTRRTGADDVFSDDPFCRPNIPSRSSYTLIPRELPPRPDPHSVHFPGFVVHQDLHIFSYNSLPFDDDCEVVEDDEESWKENSRVVATKNLATPRDSSFSKAFLDGDKSTLSPKFKPGSSTRPPCTNVASLTPAALSKKKLGKSLEAKKNPRRILLDELDFEEGGITEE